MGPVLYSLGDVVTGAGGTQTPVIATLHQIAKDPGPHPSGPMKACGGGSHNPQRHLPRPSQGLSGPFPLSVDSARLGPEWLRSRVHFTSCLPTLYLASVCPVVSHVFLPNVRLSVQFVYFETHLGYPDFM